MKNFIFIMICFLCLSFLKAQDVFEKKTPLEKDKTAVMNFDFADKIIVKTSESSEARVKATVNINDNADNDKYGLTVEPVPSGVRIKGEIKNPESLKDNAYEVSDGVITKSDGHCIKINIDYEVFLPAGTSVQMETISGNVEISGFEPPMTIKTISGFIDASVNPKTETTFEMETITGEIYSDLDLETEETKHDMRVFRGGNINANLNGGGKPIKLETISGDIYLRKEK